MGRTWLSVTTAVVLIASTATVFLVRRASADAFLAEIRSFAEGQEGVRCEDSGPWPPYSFAVLTEETAP